jgi:hypothetical protein
VPVEGEKEEEEESVSIASYAVPRKGRKREKAANRVSEPFTPLERNLIDLARVRKRLLDEFAVLEVVSEDRFDLTMFRSGGNALPRRAVETSEIAPSLYLANLNVCKDE